MDSLGDPHAQVRVIGSHGHPCLWPAAFPVPFGWTTSRCPAPREEAQAYVDCLQHTPVLEEDPTTPKRRPRC